MSPNDWQFVYVPFADTSGGGGPTITASNFQRRIGCPAVDGGLEYSRTDFAALLSQLNRPALVETLKWPLS